jgi:hypothetical protein
VSGKRQHEEYVEKNRVIQEQYADEIISNQLYVSATNIANQEKIPFVDAIEKAKRQIEEENKHLQEK